MFRQFWVDICCFLPLSSSNAFGPSILELLDIPSSVFVAPFALPHTLCLGMTLPSPLSCSQPSSGNVTLILNEEPPSKHKQALCKLLTDNAAGRSSPERGTSPFMPLSPLSHSSLIPLHPSLIPLSFPACCFHSPRCGLLNLHRMISNYIFVAEGINLLLRLVCFVPRQSCGAGGEREPTKPG